MNREEAQALLAEKLREYDVMGYAQLAALVGHEEFPDAVGASGTQYQMEIQIRWDDQPGGDVRVLGSIDDGGWRAFVPLTQDLVVARDRDATSPES